MAGSAAPGRLARSTEVVAPVEVTGAADPDEDEDPDEGEDGLVPVGPVVHTCSTGVAATVSAALGAAVTG